jgi:hypothetical protein
MPILNHAPMAVREHPPSEVEWYKCIDTTPGTLYPW